MRAGGPRRPRGTPRGQPAMASRPAWSGSSAAGAARCLHGSLRFDSAIQRGSWHRVVAALGKWMASADPLETHPGTADPAVLLDRLVSVLGAGREIPAPAPQRVEGRR